MIRAQRNRCNIYKLLGNGVLGDVASIESDSDATKLGHIRLFHLTKHGMMELHKKNLLKGARNNKMYLCKYCVHGK